MDTKRDGSSIRKIDISEEDSPSLRYGSASEDDDESDDEEDPVALPQNLNKKSQTLNHSILALLRKTIKMN